MTCDKPAQVNRRLVVLKRERESDSCCRWREKLVGFVRLFLPFFFFFGGTVDKIEIIMFVGG